MAENNKNNSSPVTVAGDGNVATPEGTPLEGVTQKDIVEDNLNLVDNPNDETIQPVIDNLKGEVNPDLNEEIINATKSSISDSKQQLEILDDIKDANIEELKTDATSDIKSAEESKVKKEEILSIADDKVAALESEQQAELDRQVKQQAEQLQAEKELATASAKTQIELTKKENELQRQRDQEAILEAKTGIEVSLQRSAIAFQEMGLGMSSGIILESQRIATEGLTDVARLKVEAELNQDRRDADIQKQITESNQLSLQYTNSINEAINIYRTNTLSLKTSSIERINALSLNKFNLEEDLAEQKKTIVDEYRKGVKEEQEAFLTKQKEYKEQIKADAYNLRNEMKAIEDDNKTALSLKISSGALTNMSVSERKILAEKAGLSIDELDFLEDNEKVTNIYSETQRLLGSDYLLSESEMVIIKNRVDGYLKSGKGMLEASTLAVKSALGSKAAALASSGTSVSSPNYKFVVDANGNQIAINEDTLETKPVTVYGGRTSPSEGEAGPRFSNDYFSPPVNLKINTSANNTANKTTTEETSSSIASEYGL